MRINKYIALASGLSRRAADAAVQQGNVTVDDRTAAIGQEVNRGQVVAMNGQRLELPAETHTIVLNKPAGYVVSRNGQGAKTIYDLLPQELHRLKSVGRLDKDSSGLLLLTDNGVLANELTHPGHRKKKIYEIRLDKPLAAADLRNITSGGVALDDGISKFELHRLHNNTDWIATLYEGRNRQIRRTFKALGYKVTRLHRTQFGNYRLPKCATGQWTTVNHTPDPSAQ